MAVPTRFATEDDYRHERPIFVVWELTLACDLRCVHCGSRAGQPRSRELTTEECRSVIADLAELGTREVTLIGGEAYLRRDWLEIVRAIGGAGIGCSLQSGGRRLTEPRLRAAKEAGLQSLGISLDGLPALHDRLRGVAGSFAAACGALRAAHDLGLPTTANTQLTAAVVPQLGDLMAQLIELGVTSWQVQLTVPMGRAADNPEILLQPHQLMEVMPLLAQLHKEGVARGLTLQTGNNIGYFGPYEELLRGSGAAGMHWVGCAAAVTSMGIEADGTIKGCPSLPTAPYAGGNVRDGRLRDLWRDSSVLHDRPGRGPTPLWGFCSGCYYATVCRGGCTWMTHSLFGVPGNNPYCHHRALELHRQGLRERIVPSSPAPGRPFDHGRHSLVIERLDGGGAREVTPPVAQQCGGPLLQIGRRPTRDLPAQLEVCRRCHRHVFAQERDCPHCGRSLRRSRRRWERKRERARRQAQALLARIPAST
jgi:radical SAM protein with 4Fe4S-binding SPASM domain